MRAERVQLLRFRVQLLRFAKHVNRRLARIERNVRLMAALHATEVTRLKAQLRRAQGKKRR
jgi:hypothetical protein